MTLDGIHSKGLVPTLILLGLNTLVVLITFIVSFFCPKGTRATVRIHALIFLVCPIVGFSAWAIYELIFFILRVCRFDSESLGFSTARANLPLPPDTESEINYVPVRDALAVSDTASLRSFMLNLLKSKSVIETNGISNAISSDDAETSHYAASAVTNYLSHFRAGVQSRLKEIEKHPHDPLTLLGTVDFLRETLAAHIMDPIEQKTYIYTLENIFDKLYENHRWLLTASHYLCITDFFIEIGAFSNAMKWALHAKECRPGELETYKCMIHLDYATNDSEALFAEIEELKSSDILIDKELLDFIRLISKNSALQYSVNAHGNATRGGTSTHATLDGENEHLHSI